MTEPIPRPSGNPLSVNCQQNYSVFLPFDDFTDRSCRHVHACAVGSPSPRTIGTDKVMSFDGNSYVELPSFDMGNAGASTHQMTIVVRFKVTTRPQDFSMILSNGEIDTMPTVDIHINNQNKLVAGINGVYFSEQQVSQSKRYYNWYPGAISQRVHFRC